MKPKERVHKPGLGIAGRRNAGKERTRSTREIVFRDLGERMRLIEKIYNPENENLHFTAISRTNAALFEALYSIGLETWGEILKDPSRSDLHKLYKFFLIVNSASVKIIIDGTQADYSKSLVQKIAFLLVDTCQHTFKRENEGDITLRNDEALHSLLHAFDFLEKPVIKKVKQMDDPTITRIFKRLTKSGEEINTKGDTEV